MKYYVIPTNLFIDLKVFSRIQRYLFNFGYSWCVGKIKLYYPIQFYSKYFVFSNGNKFMYFSSENFYEKHKLLTIEDFFKLDLNKD